MRTTDRAVVALAAAVLVLSLLAPAPALASSPGAERGHATAFDAPVLDPGAWMARLHSWLAGLWPAAGDAPPTALFGREGSDMDPNGTPSSEGTTESGLDGEGSWEFVAPEGGDMDPNG